MAFVARQPFATKSARHPFAADSASLRSTTVCRIHSCVRCKSAIDSAEPCSFVRTELRICGVCRGQEQVLKHLPLRRGNWAAGLARLAA
jgi:hypothetical protein